MSRCFPFPPPGYERKDRPEDLDLLKEAKRKEKKHKKEKKDKERNKDKVKKEKDGGDEKHRDKKERKGKDKSKKEKNRDKKKEKEDHGKDKEKSSISEESTVAGILAAESDGKLHPEGLHSKDRNSFSNDGKFSGLFQGQTRNDESKFVLELDRRINEEKGQGSQLPERLAFEEKKNQEVAARVAISSSSSAVLSEENGDNKNKRVDRNIDPHELRNEFSEHARVQNLIPIAKSKFEGIPRPANEQNGWRLEDKEKHKETGGVKQGQKKKDRDKESHGKRKGGEKEKKKNDKAKWKREDKKGEQDKLKDDGMNDLGGLTANKSADLLKDSNSNAINEGNIRKRKDMGANGFLHDSEMRPHKIPKPAPHHSTENGRKLEPFPTPSKPSHDKHAIPNSDRVDHKERLMNGIIETPKPSPSKLNPSGAGPIVSDKIAEPSSKIRHRDSNSSIKARKVPKIEDPVTEASSSRRPRPPHPDSKYLAEVLTVPKMTADLSESDDQDWLFSKKAPTKPKTGSVGPDDDLRVWSEAVHIESADVIALPYVIPY